MAGHKAGHRSGHQWTILPRKQIDIRFTEPAIWLTKPLVERGLLIGNKDAPLKVAFPLGQSERLFPHLWAPSDVENTSMTPEIEEALRPP